MAVRSRTTKAIQINVTEEVALALRQWAPEQRRVSAVVEKLVWQELARQQERDRLREHVTALLEEGKVYA